MKTKILLLLLLVWAGIVSGQENFKRTYFIPTKVGEIVLKKNQSLKFADWKKEDIDSIKKIYPQGTLINISEETEIKGKTHTLTRDVKIDENFYQDLTIKKSEKANGGFFGYVKFDENRIIVNRNLSENDKNENSIYYYELKNRDNVGLYFIEGTFSAFTIPIKYRFKQPNVSEEFSAAALNANLFVGVSVGKTKFFYRDKVGSITNNHKLTLGAFLGSSVVELNRNNTSAAEIPLSEDVKIMKGLASIGFGLAYSYNKVNIGGFLGWDYAIGLDSEKWNYNKKPWIGIAVGYSLFNL